MTTIHISLQTSSSGNVMRTKNPTKYIESMLLVTYKLQIYSTCHLRDIQMDEEIGYRIYKYLIVVLSITIPATDTSILSYHYVVSKSQLNFAACNIY